VITGVSSGIGFDTTRFLIEKGYRVFGSVRSETDANRLQRQFGAAYFPIIINIKQESSIKQAAAVVRDQLEGKILDVLINNAGIAVSGPLENLHPERLREQFEVNNVGLLIMTQAFLPLLGADGSKIGPKGRIINISSVSGKITTPFMGPYSASKFALEAMSDAMRRELALHGIKVIIVQPGPIKTEIWNKAKTEEREQVAPVYQPFLKHSDKIIEKRSKGALPVEQVSKLLYNCIRSRNPADRYLITKNAWMIKLILMLPVSLVDYLIMKAMKA